MMKRIFHTITHHPIASGIRDTLLNVLSPAHCSACSSLLDDRAILCSICYARIQPIVSTTIDLNAHHALRVFAITGYQEPLRRLIIAKSWSDIVASNHLGQLIWERTYISQIHFDYIVPIPLHWTRYAWRGFNQAEEMGRVLAHKSGKPLISLLKRRRWTPFQSRLERSQRSANVSNVFTLAMTNPAPYAGKHILLVDDLMTTGSTLKEAGRALLLLKPATITAVVACRAV